MNTHSTYSLKNAVAGSCDRFPMGSEWIQSMEGFRE